MRAEGEDIHAYIFSPVLDGQSVQLLPDRWNRILVRRVSKKHNHSIKIKAKGQRFSSGFDTTGGNAPLSCTRNPEKNGADRQ